MEQLSKSPKDSFISSCDEPFNFSLTIEQHLQKNSDRIYRLNIDTEQSYFKIASLKMKINTFRTKISTLPRTIEGSKLAVYYFEDMQNTFGEIMQLFMKSKNDLSELKGLINSSRCAFGSYKPAKELEKCDNGKILQSIDVDSISYMQDVNLTKEVLLQNNCNHNNNDNPICQEDELRCLLTYTEVINDNILDVFNRMATLVMECVAMRNDIAKTVREFANINVALIYN